MRSVFILTICAILLCSGLRALAQEPLMQGEVLQTVTISGTRTAAAAAISRTGIDSLQLARAANASFAELLSTRSHIFVKTYGQGSLATVSFRGTAASHTKVEWNGITVNNPMLGQVDFSLIPVWFVDHTEILHGGSSLRNGSGALGGAVRTGSLVRWDSKFYGTLVQGAGSFGHYQAFASAGGGGAKIQGRVRYMYQRADNHFKFYNDRVIPQGYAKQQNADYNRHGGVADLWWRDTHGRNIISAHAWFHDDRRNLPAMMSYQGAARTEFQEEQQVRTVVKWLRYGEKSRLEMTSGYSYNKMRYFLASPTSFGQLVNYDSRSLTHTYNNRVNYEYGISGKFTLRVTANADHNYVHIQDTSRRSNNAALAAGYGARRTETGVSAAIYYEPSGYVSLFALVREDLTAGKFSPPMPSAGAQYRPLGREVLTFKINATRNYHQPTLNDLYWQPGGNPALSPEKGYTFDTAAEFVLQRGKMSYKAGITGYLSWIDDWIIWRPGNYYYWSAENIRKVFARGTELTASLGHSSSGHAATLSANYAFTRTTNERPLGELDRSGGKQLIYVPVHKANIIADVSCRGYYMVWLWSVVSRRYTTSSNEVQRNELPGYDLHDLTLGKRLDFKNTGLDLQFKVNNLFDARYQAILSRAMPGRNYTFLLKITF